MFVYVFFFKKKCRPTIPPETEKKLSDLIKSMWEREPSERPEFSQINTIMDSLRVSKCKQKNKQTNKPKQTNKQ